MANIISEAKIECSTISFLPKLFVIEMSLTWGSADLSAALGTLLFRANRDVDLWTVLRVLVERTLVGRRLPGREACWGGVTMCE